MNNSGNLKVTARGDREIVLPEWLVNTGPFDDSWVGEAEGTAAVVEQDGRTTVTITLLREHRESCDPALKSQPRPGSSPKAAELLALTLALADAQAVA